MQYLATIIVKVKNADGTDKPYLERIARDMREYLSYEGEEVEVEVVIQEPMLASVGEPTLTVGNPPASE